MDCGIIPHAATASVCKSVHTGPWSPVVAAWVNELSSNPRLFDVTAAVFVVVALLVIRKYGRSGPAAGSSQSEAEVAALFGAHKVHSPDGPIPIASAVPVPKIEVGQALKVKWGRDEDHLTCLGCGKEFGLVRRRHHCRGCGRVLCDACTPPPRMELPPSFGVTPFAVGVPHSASSAFDVVVRGKKRICGACAKLVRRITSSALNKEGRGVGTSIDGGKGGGGGGVAVELTFEDYDARDEVATSLHGLRGGARAVAGGHGRRSMPIVPEAVAKATAAV